MRGALMLSISCTHPEAEEFISSKLEQGKVTGANISIKLTDEFMKCVEEDKEFIQYFPTHLDKNKIVPENVDLKDLNKLKEGLIPESCYKVIRAKDLWDKIISNAHRSAEPGVLFWSNVLNNTPTKPYFDKGYKPTSTNPCGEIPLQPFDSCRLLHLNLYSFVEDPFTPNAKFNFIKLSEYVRLATRMLDDIVDLELEKVEKIINKIKSDPEEDSIKRTELELWEKIYDAGFRGRRLGLGTTADGDMVAALGLRYGTEEANDKLEEVHKYIAMCSYIESIDLAVDRGPFKDFEWELEKDDYFVNKILNAIREEFGEDAYNEYYDKWKNHGRRNICNLTLAPTGCVKSSSKVLTSEGLMSMEDIFNKSGYDVNDLSEKGLKDLWLDPSDDILVPNINGKLNKITKLYWKGECLGNKVTFDDGSDVSCTDIHKFLVKLDNYSEIWKESKDLVPGDRVYSVDNLYKEVKNVVKDSFYACDIEVESDHYYILSNGVVTHNTTSLMTQTSSGFEPVFSLFYQRKRKIDDKRKADFIDEVGDAFEINNVIHPKFIDWFISYTTENKPNPNYVPHTYESAKEYLSKLSSDKLNELIKLSPYYGATANEIDPVMKVKLQGRIQNWIDNSISCTVNMKSDTKVETVDKVYLEAYKSGCKGVTCYVDGCRSGVLTTSSPTMTKKDEDIIPIRPDELEAEVVRFKNNDEYWIAYVGIKDGKPYEIFTGLEDKDDYVLPKSITKGKLVRVKDKKGKKRYDFTYIDKYGYTNTIGGVSHMFNKVYWNYAKLISGYLRYNVPIVDTLNVLEGLSFDKETINTWKNGVIRALKKFVSNGSKSKSKCPECGETLVYEEGCLKCPNCGYSKCGG